MNAGAPGPDREAEPLPDDPAQGFSLGEFASGIGFRAIQPMQRPWPFYQPRYLPPRRPRDSATLERIIRRLDLAAEIGNTRLPAVADDMKERLAPLCEIPRMSTYAIAALINLGVARMRPDTCFVNVGVWHGFTLLAGMAGNPGQTCIGVDNFSEFGGPRDAFLRRFEQRRSAHHHFFDIGYEEYFAGGHEKPIGFYLYDGEHSYEHQLQGLRVAEPFFAEDCVVLVDDTNLPAPRDALFDFIDQSDHDYRVLCDRRTRGNLHPTLWNGVMMIQRTA